jgi:hypothetical protein
MRDVGAFFARLAAGLAFSFFAPLPLSVKSKTIMVANCKY